jgi:hypothetical protein
MVEKCSVEQCQDEVFSRTWCQLHYHRWWRLGDPEARLTRLSPNTPIDVRLWSRVDLRGPDECWPWQGSRDGGGYGILRVGAGKSKAKAHRLSYELAYGPIPDGLEIDHVCHSRDQECRGGLTCPHRQCVNPAHLEAVSHRENGLRGRSFALPNAMKTHCPQGHPYDSVNTYISPSSGGRVCRTCTRESQRRYQQRKAAQRIAEY